MEQASKNRLQFVHHDECFPTREEAIAYVVEGQVLERPTLYAEPMVLKYGDAENPNIILAIGSVGEGNASTTNKTFFIDVAHIDETVKEIAESVEADEQAIEEIRGMVSNIIESCGLNENGTLEPFENEIIADVDSLADAVGSLADYVKEMEGRLSISVGDTNTVDLTLENGKITADSIFPDKFSFDGRVFLTNQLNKEDIEGNKSGHFVNVDLAYEGNGTPLQLVVNGDVVKEIDIPEEKHVVSGVYDQFKEAVIINLSDNSQVEISLERLAAELRVETPRTSPVELKLQRVGPTNIDGQDEYKSILSAKVYVSNDADNIVEIQDDGESDAVLYVKGTADNIKYNHITVKDALDSLEAAVENEKARAIAVESELDAKVDSLSGSTDGLQEALDNESFERQAADNELNGKIDAVSGYADAISGQVHVKEYEIKNLIRETSGALETNIEDVDKHRTLEVSQLGSENLKLMVDDSSEEATYINGYVKVLEANDNIIEGGNSIIGGALYATAKMSYSPKLNAITFETSGPRDGATSTFYLNNADLNYDPASNELTYTYTIADSLSASTMASKKWKLSAFGVIDHIVYDDATESIIIYYQDASQVMQHIVVPVGDLFEELIVEDTNTIDLTKTRTTSGGSDILKADVKLSQNDGNMLTARNDGLYVPSSGVAANAAAIAELSGKTAENTSNISEISTTVQAHESRIETLENNSSSAEEEIDALAERVTATEGRLDVLQGNALVEGSVANAVASALTESKDYTDEKVDAVTLEGSSAITVDYTNKQVSLKINGDLNTEGYLKTSENGIYVSGVDAAIESTTSGKADADSVYTKDEADSKFATNESASALEERVSEAETSIENLDNDVDALSDRVTEVENRVTDTENAINTLNGNELQEGSVAYVAKQYADEVKDYTDGVKDELNDKIDEAQADIDHSVKTVTLHKHDDNELTYDLIYTNNIGVSFTGGTLNIPEDKFLKSVSYDPATKKLTMVFIVESGTTTQVIDLSDLVDLYTGGQTITIDNNNVIEVKVCNHEHNEYLKVCEDGLYVGGIDAAIEDAISGKADAASVYTKTEADNLFARKSDLDAVSGVVSTNTSDIETLKSEVSTISANTSGLSESILASAYTYTDNKVSELRTEVSNVSGTLQTEIDSKADASDVYTKSEIDEMIGEIPSYSGDIASLSGQIQTVSGQVQTVSGTANEALDLANEIKLTYNWNVLDTPTVNLEKTASTNSGSTLSAEVKISTTSGNSVTADTSGIYVGLSKLEYNTGSNQLRFTNANGESNTIQLNSADILHDIYYDGETDKLVFVFIVEGEQGPETRKVEISAAAFFKGIIGTSEGNVTVTTALTQSGESSTATAITANLDVNDIIDNTNGNVTLGKVSVDNNKIQANLDVNDIVNTGDSLTRFVQVEFRKTNDNKILGYVGISTLENNVLTSDAQNELFVPKEASNYTCIYSGTTMSVQEAITNLENNIGTDDNLYRVVGVTSGDTSISRYVGNCNYISGDTNIVDALKTLDDELANKQTALSGIDTDSIDITINSGSTTTIQADVKLSEQTIPYDEENPQSPRGENILQILNDGLYFGGIIDCGEY